VTKDQIGSVSGAMEDNDNDSAQRHSRLRAFARPSAVFDEPGEAGTRMHRPIIGEIVSIHGEGGTKERFQVLARIPLGYRLQPLAHPYGEAIDIDELCIRKART